MQVVGVNSYDKRFPFERYLREAAIFPIYDAANMGMQRRLLHNVLADSGFNPRAVMDSEFVEFTKHMEGIDTAPGRSSETEIAIAQHTVTQILM